MRREMHEGKYTYAASDGVVEGRRAGTYGTAVFHLGRVCPNSFSPYRVSLVIAFAPITDSARCPNWMPSARVFSTSLKCFESQRAIFVPRVVTNPARRCLVRSPVLIFTGQAWAHNPSTAQVSR